MKGEEEGIGGGVAVGVKGEGVEEEEEEEEGGGKEGRGSKDSSVGVMLVSESDLFKDDLLDIGVYSDDS